MLSQNLHRFKNVLIPDVSKLPPTCVKDATKQFIVVVTVKRKLGTMAMIPFAVKTI